MEEIWKDVVGYEGLYQISNYGRVKSLPKLHGRRISEERILKNKVNRYGYHQVCLCKGSNHRKYPYVHRLVADAFLEKPNENYEVNHIDGDKNNNKLENLEWLDHQSNIVHGWDNGLMENVRNAPAEQFGFNCRLINIKNGNVHEFESHKELSRFLGFAAHWLSNSIRQCSDYEKTCKEKGYFIELSKLRKENKGKIKYILTNLTSNEEHYFHNNHELCKFFNRTLGWMNYSKQVGKFEKEINQLGFKLEGVS